MNEHEYQLPDSLAEPQERGSGPQRAFFQTVAGPGATAYPEDVDPKPRVYYARKLKNVSFPHTVGYSGALTYETTSKYEYLFNLEPSKYIEEGSIVLGFKEYVDWFTIDKVPSPAFITTRRLKRDSLVVSWNGDYGVDTSHVSNPDSAGLVWATTGGVFESDVAREFDLNGELSGRSIGGYLGAGAIKVDGEDRIVLLATVAAIIPAVLARFSDPDGPADWSINERYSRFELTTADGVVAGYAYIAITFIGGFLSIAAAGTEIWRTPPNGSGGVGFTSNGGPVDTALDASGNVFGLGADTTQDTLWKLNSSGTLVWSVANPCGLDGFPTGVAVDSQGSPYVCGYDIGGTAVSLRKYDADGAFVAEWDAGLSLNAIAIDADDNVYVVGRRGTAAGDDEIATCWKLDADLTLLERFDHGDDLHDVQVGPAGHDFVYVTGKRVAA